MDRFQLVNRFTREWKSFIDVVIDTQNYMASVVDRLTDLFENSNYLKPTHLKEAAETVLKVQDMYGLNARLLANGVFSDETITETRLTADNCYELAFYAMQADKIGVSAEWLREVIPRVNPNTDDIVFFRQQLENVIVASYMNGNLQTTKLFTHILTEMAPDFKVNDLQNLLLRLNATLDRLHDTDFSGEEEIKFSSLVRKDIFTEITEKDQAVIAEEVVTNFKKSLCRGDLVSAIQNSSLPSTCMNIPAYGRSIWGYDKEEIISLDPLVLQFNNLVSPKEAEVMLDTAKTMLSSYETDKTGRVTSLTTINTAVLEISEHPFLKALDDRIRRILGLKEANLYHEIVDRGYVDTESLTYYDHKVFDEGDYIGTLLIFLNEPIEGGYTVFPELKLRIKPKSYAAMYWPNDPEKVDWVFQPMEAIECPLLVGFKWCK